MDLQQNQMQQQLARCAICFTTQQLLRCAKCKSAYYCSVAHQHMDWPAHKPNCRLLAKQKKNNMKIQQLQHAAAFNGIQAPPTTTFPLAAATYVNSSTQQQQQQQQLMAEQMTLSNVNVNYGIAANAAFTGNYIDGDAGVSASLNTNQNCNDQTTVIHGANENLILNSQQNVNMLVNPTTIEMDQQFYMDPNTNALNMNNVMHQDTSRQVLTTLSELTIEQQTASAAQHQQHQTFSPQYQITQQPQQQHQQLQLQNEQELPYEEQPAPHQQSLSQAYAHFRYQNNLHEKSSSYQIGQGDENVMANFNERRYEELCRNIINDMNQYGLSVVDDFLGVEKGMEILGEVHDMYCAGVFQDGQLVNNRKTEQDLNRTIRGDKITWVKGVEQGCTSVGYLINQIDAVICRANTMKNNGKLGNYNIKERTKAMVACYPGSGTHYVTHVDNPNKDGRVITAIYYLNVDWDAKRSGGVLRIFPEASNTVADIEPKFDRLIFFWSDKRNPHEVQPSHRTRYAITVWYFDANEREAALNRCKYGNVIKTTAESSSSTSKHNFHHNNSSNSNSNSQKNNSINSSNISHLPAGFSKANENSNPNFNANSPTPATQQTNLHKKEICA